MLNDYFLFRTTFRIKSETKFINAPATPITSSSAKRIKVIYKKLVFSTMTFVVGKFSDTEFTSRNKHNLRHNHRRLRERESRG